MSAVTPCVPCCTTPQSVAVPGPQGPTGPTGAGTVTSVTGDAYITVTNGTTTPALALNGAPIPITQGGTGQVTAGTAFASLYAGSTLPIANGGTGATTAAAALTALGAQAIPPDPINSPVSGSVAMTRTTTPGVRVLNSDVPLTQAGTWLLILTVRLDSANFDGNAAHNFNMGLYRINNTPGLITNGLITSYWGKDLFNNDGTNPNTFLYATKTVIYTTANANDEFHVYGWYEGVPSAGTVEVTFTEISAVFIK